jgi:hypothetical protein
MSDVHLALSMIVKGDSEQEGFRECLRSIVPHVDEVCVLETYCESATNLKVVALEICMDLDVPLTWEV